MFYMQILRPWMPKGHPNIDTLISTKTPIPVGHPKIDPYLCFDLYLLPPAAKNITCPVVFTNHPSVDLAVATQERLPTGHPLIDPMLRAILPKGHSNIDTIFGQAVLVLPFGHPAIDPYLCYPAPPPAVATIGLCSFHPPVDATLQNGAVPYAFPTSHPKVQPLLAPFMPSSHPNVDTLLKNGKHPGSTYELGHLHSYGNSSCNRYRMLDLQGNTIHSGTHQWIHTCISFLLLFNA